MMIPMWVDENKDSKLIKFLAEQTNRSAFLRERVYEYMRGINYQTRIIEEKIDESFMDSLMNFGNK